ncbi:MAG: GNAT family N-acetyltransferase [Nitrospinae bacterium]|nr:GNAT family N-acetyltransferase [Nitrospinota bacterium]
MPEFIIAKTEEDYREARVLLREYEAASEVDLCFQGFEEEVEALERVYGPPGGRFLLMRAGDDTAGCVALRDLGNKICEMKRLYLRPGFRGRGLGRRSAERIVHEAREMGYAAMRLDTLPTMQEAITLYCSMGFREISPYTKNPVEGALFMEMGLG